MSANISEFIGSYLSLDCGDPLGIYQGEVDDVNKNEQTISLKNPFHNGLKTTIPLVTISAKDIKELKILRTQEQVLEENESKVSKLGSKTKPTHINTCNVKSKSDEHQPRNKGQRSPKKKSQAFFSQSFFSQSSNGKHEENGFQNQLINGETENGFGHDVVYSSSLKNGDGSNSKNNPRMPPRRSHLDAHVSPGKMDRSLERLNGKRNGKNWTTDDTTPVKYKNGDRKFDEQEDKGSLRQRHNSGSFDQKSKSSPRKIEGRGKILRARKDVECFSAPTESYLGDFDFEGNLALFDKAAIFEAIDAKSGSSEAVNSPKQEPKFRHDEMIVDTGKPAAKRQILVNECGDISEYKTDEGYIVPSISQELQEKLFSMAEKLGLTVERRIEAVGRTAASMALQVLGGVNRITFENAHQLPTIVVLCGPHLQGAQGACCARHLANHNLPVTLLAPNLVRMHDLLDHEIKLFQETDGIFTTNYKDLPAEPVDLLICALDSHHTHIRSQGWYQTAVQWASKCKAPLLTLDPPSNQTIPSKWALAIGLPFTYGNSVGKLYLGDIGIPKKVFNSVGVKYISPFGHKFVIPLHNPDAP